jgi:hypothetical protein
VDDVGVSSSGPRGGPERLPGAAPLVEHIVRSLLEERIVTAAREALDRGGGVLVDDGEIERLTVRAIERELAELADPPAPYYLTLEEWVGEWLFPVYRRSVLGHERTWCPQWWRHAEAVARLESLWRAWEHLRLDPATGLSVWFRDHADHHMTILLDADGPFKGCDGQHSERPLDELPHEPPPGGMFEPEAAAIAAGASASAGERAAGKGRGGRDGTIRRAR